jgi:aryl-alcohol dehydrogenase-like predicted oxidoreductase
MGILCYSALAQGLLTGKFASADDVSPGRARTKHFSKNRPETRHSEEGCEEEVFAAIDKLRDVSQRLNAPMADIALAWLLYQPGVTSVLAGARTPAQLTQNAAAADLTLPDEILTELDDMTADIKMKLGPDPDMWSSESRFR